jgi:hypothetical protein
VKKANLLCGYLQKCCALVEFCSVGLDVLSKVGANSLKCLTKFKANGANSTDADHFCKYPHNRLAFVTLYVGRTRRPVGATQHLSGNPEWFIMLKNFSGVFGVSNEGVPDQVKTWSGSQL